MSVHRSRISSKEGAQPGTNPNLVGALQHPVGTQKLANFHANNPASQPRQPQAPTSLQVSEPPQPQKPDPQVVLQDNTSVHFKIKLLRAVEIFRETTEGTRARALMACNTAFQTRMTEEAFIRWELIYVLAVIQQLLKADRSQEYAQDPTFSRLMSMQCHLPPLQCAAIRTLGSFETNHGYSKLTNRFQTIALLTTHIRSIITSLNVGPNNPMLRPDINAQVVIDDPLFINDFTERLVTNWNTWKQAYDAQPAGARQQWQGSDLVIPPLEPMNIPLNNNANWTELQQIIQAFNIPNGLTGNQAWATAQLYHQTVQWNNATVAATGLVPAVYELAAPNVAQFLNDLQIQLDTYDHTYDSFFQRLNIKYDLFKPSSGGNACQLVVVEDNALAWSTCIVNLPAKDIKIGNLFKIGLSNELVNASTTLIGQNASQIKQMNAKADCFMIT